MSQRVRNAEFRLHGENMLESSLKSHAALAIEERLARFGKDASLHFDSDAWAAMIAEQRHLIAHAAGVDPSKVKIYVGH